MELDGTDKEKVNLDEEFMIALHRSPFSLLGAAIAHTVLSFSAHLRSLNGPEQNVVVAEMFIAKILKHIANECIERAKSMSCFDEAMKNQFGVDTKNEPTDPTEAPPEVVSAPSDGA